jgi:predicted small secreted protein
MSANFELWEIAMKKLALLIVLLSTFAVLSGCNTVRGIGQDVEKGGEAIQKAVK